MQPPTQQPDLGDWRKLWSDLQVYLRWSIAGLIDCAFLAFWLLVQHWFGILTSDLTVTGIDQVQYQILQVIFAVSTLTPIIIFLLKDLIVMAVQAYRIISHEVASTARTSRASTGKPEAQGEARTK